VEDCLAYKRPPLVAGDWTIQADRALGLRRWSGHRIEAECDDAHAGYLDELRWRHINYYERRPEQRAQTHAFMAATLEYALPPGWNHLGQSLGLDSWHRYHLSAASSQVLALALLAAATALEPTLEWLPLARPNACKLLLFEIELGAHVLNEHPYQTALDALVIGHDQVIAVEAKFTEPGFGQCRCACATSGQCAERIFKRPYWAVATRTLGLHPQSGSCSLSLAYQPVRNLAAAEAIADKRHPGFVLFYDARNPYFAGAGAWPGWSKTLARLTEHSPIPFAAKSWQELLRDVKFEASLLRWADEKHGLIPA
jgi:hypothetical protein